MMNPISGSVPVAAMAQAAPPAPAPQAASSGGGQGLTPDTANISPQGQQMAHASQDADHDGDSH